MFFDSDNVRMFVYKTGRSSISVTWDDYYRLEEGEFLNDTVIEFYICYMQDLWSEETRQSVHVFNSFFYSNLTTKPKGGFSDTQLYTEKQRVNYHMVNRWTKNNEVFENKFVFVPINEK